MVLSDDGDGPLLFASAGIGCTPMVAMLAHLAATGSRRRIITAHADRSPATHPFRTDLRRLTGKLADATAELWYEEGAGVEEEGAGRETGGAVDAVTVHTGLMDLTRLAIPAGTTAYLCGPVPFMKAVRAQLLDSGVPSAAIHYEVFGPDLGL